MRGTSLSCSLFFTFFSLLYAETPIPGLAEKLVPSLEQAVRGKDQSALEKLINFEDVNDQEKDAILARFKETFNLADPVVQTGPRLDWLEGTTTINGRLYSLNGKYEATIYIFSSSRPGLGAFFPAGYTMLRGHQLLAYAPLREGTRLPGKPSRLNSPYYPEGYSPDISHLKPGTPIKDPWTGRYYLVPAPGQPPSSKRAPSSQN